MHVRAWARRLAIAGATAGAMTAGAPGRADAACTASTPASQRLADNASDGQLGLAPEITFVDATLGSACDLVVLTSLGDRSATVGLIPYETLATYIDTDGNPATGSPSGTAQTRSSSSSASAEPARRRRSARGPALLSASPPGLPSRWSARVASPPISINSGCRVRRRSASASPRAGPAFAIPTTTCAEAGRPVVRLPGDLHHGRRAACSSHPGFPGRRPRPDDLHSPERAAPAVAGGAQEACARRVPLAGRQRLEQPQAPARVAHPPGRRHVDHSAGCRRRGAFLMVRHPRRSRNSTALANATRGRGRGLLARDSRRRVHVRTGGQTADSSRSGGRPRAKCSRSRRDGA